MTDFPTLTIRGLRADDWMALQPLFADESVLHDTLDVPYASEEAFRERLISPPAGTHTLIAELMLPSGRERVVGLAWLRVMVPPRRRHTATLQIVVHADYRAGEIEEAVLRAALDLADNWLALRRVEMRLFATDHARAEMLARHGFAQEAVMRRYAVRAGEHVDAWLLARLWPGREAVAEAGEGGA
ncbi:MAG: GNAT family N-acetyltransferase [Chloroflexota bacterium]